MTRHMPWIEVALAILRGAPNAPSLPSCSATTHNGFPVFEGAFVGSNIERAAVGAALVLFAAVAQANTGMWEYDTKPDKMSSKETKFASITSVNSLDLPFPYKSSSNHGFLYVRQTSNQGVDVFVSVMEGQILCPGYGDGCTVSVRFDNDKPSRYRAVGPNDHSSRAFFIHDTRRFLAGAKKARKILVQFTMYNAGEQVLEFSPATPLTWGAPPAKKK